MSNLEITIENIRAIKKLDVSLPIKKGIFLICGNNGIGKSTLMSIMSKIVYKTALNKYIRNTDGDAKIIYRYKDNINTWTPNKFGSWSQAEKDSTHIFFYGSYESSFIFGNRFTDAHKSKIKNSFKNKHDSIQANEMVTKNLGFIIRNDVTFYSDLQITQTIPEGLQNYLYFLKKNNHSISQFQMSSGEYLVLSLLDYIEVRRLENNKNKRNNSDPAIIIIDEIDLALHPSAQARLIQYLRKIVLNRNLCIYISSHSPTITSKINPENIFLLQQNSQKLEIVNKCYPGYAIRHLEEELLIDRLILVEDKLAKRYIEKIIEKNPIGLNAITKILTIGGYNAVIKFHKQAEKIKLCGPICKIMSILDGDIAEVVKKEYPEENKYLNMFFLPIKSFEKYLYQNLILEENDEFRSYVEKNFFQHKVTIQDFLNEYKKDEKSIKNGSNGKKLWNKIKKHISDNDMELENAINTLYDYIIDNTPEHEELKERVVSFLN